MIDQHVMSLCLVGLLVCGVWAIGLGIVQLHKLLILPNAWEQMRENHERWQEMVAFDPHERGRR